MYLDERGYLVLKTIVNNPSITGKEVEQSLDLSRKQVSYTMDKINQYLADNGLPKIIFRGLISLDHIRNAL